MKAGTRSGIEYTYVGLKKRIRKGDERATGNKNEADLQKDFVESTLRCLRSASRPRWQAAMRLLEADPLFAALRLSDLPNLPANEIEGRAGELFESASSGHKVVLLTLTQLSELVSERTLGSHRRAGGTPSPAFGDGVRASSLRSPDQAKRCCNPCYAFARRGSRSPR